MNYWIKNDVKDSLDGDRGTGRTTNLLRSVHDMLYEAHYPVVFFVMAHAHEFRYAAPLFNHLICNQALYEHHRQRLTFRNKHGQPVHVQFVTMEDEARSTIGLRHIPIAHDHHVIERRTSFIKDPKQERVIDELNARGINPFKPIFIFTPKE